MIRFDRDSRKADSTHDDNDSRDARPEPDTPPATVVSST